MLSKNFLDVDESIMEKNLLIQVNTWLYKSIFNNQFNILNKYWFQNNEEKEFKEFVTGFLNPDAGKIIKPAPGKILII